MTAASGPLAATLNRLAAIDPWFGAELGRPEGDGWHRFDDIVDGQCLDGWLDELASRHGGRRDVAGSYLGSWLAGAAIIVPTAAFVLERRLPDPSGPLWAHRHHDGWFDRVAFERPDVLDGDGDEVVASFAGGLVARMAPVLDAVRARTPFGLRGLWGGIGDELASAALWAARAGGTDADAAWRTAVAVTDAVAGLTPWLRTRPMPFPVTTATGVSMWIVRGTCCLFYKTQPAPPDPCGESYCTTCPFRDDTSRHQRLVAHLGTASSS